MRRARRLAATAWNYARPRIRWRDVIFVALIGLSMLYNVHYVQTTERQFCQVVTGVTATPVQRPADAAANPSRETSWEWYERFVRLGRGLGC